MIVIQTLEFIITAVLYIANIKRIMGLVSERKQHNKLIYILFLPYLASSVLMSLFRDGRNPLVYLCATLLFYFLLYMIIILQYKSSKLTVAYVSLMFLSIDSIVQTLGCIILSLFTHSFNRDIALKTSSIIFNIIVVLLFSLLVKQNRNQIRNSINLLSKKLYVLILFSLILVGELCGNMAVQSSEQFFRNNINSFLTTLTILVFIIVIISFIFSSISKQYYESISKVMEKQVIIINGTGGRDSINCNSVVPWRRALLIIKTSNKVWCPNVRQPFSVSRIIAPQILKSKQRRSFLYTFLTSESCGNGKIKLRKLAHTGNNRSLSASRRAGDNYHKSFSHFYYTERLTHRLPRSPPFLRCRQVCLLSSPPEARKV